MPENTGTFRCLLPGVSASGARQGPGPDTPSARAESASPRKCIQDIGQINWSVIRSAAYSITRHNTVSEDISHDVCKRLLELPAQRRDNIECLEAFAAQMAMNAARNWHRTKGRHVSVDTLVGMTDERFPDPAVPVSSTDQVVRALAKLTPRLREPFVRHKVQGYYVEEIAQELGISVAATRKRIQRAFEIVREEDRCS